MFPDGKSRNVRFSFVTIAGSPDDDSLWADVSGHAQFPERSEIKARSYRRATTCCSRTRETAAGTWEEKSLLGGHAEPAWGSPVPQDFWVVCGTPADTQVPRVPCLWPLRARWAAITTAAVFAAASQGQEPPTNASPRHCPWETTLRTEDKTEGRGQRFSKEGAAGIRCVLAHLCWGSAFAPRTLRRCQVRESGSAGAVGRMGRSLCPLDPVSRCSEIYPARQLTTVIS